jgi:hypothetical protein
MPTLKLFGTAGAPRLSSVHKPITTVGKALGNDLVVPGAGVADHHAQIRFDGRDFQLEEIDKVADIAINGKKKRRARLVHGDMISLGAAQLQFSMFAEQQSAPRPSDDDDERPRGTAFDLSGVRKLFEFSEKLSSRKSIDELLSAMLDDVIELTHAQKGFLLLVEGAEASAAEGRAPTGDKKLVVRAARNIRKEAIPQAEAALSDSIVRQVIDTGRPLIVSDALADTTFGKQRERARAAPLERSCARPSSRKGKPSARSTWATIR